MSSFLFRAGALALLTCTLAACGGGSGGGGVVGGVPTTTPITPTSPTTPPPADADAGIAPVKSCAP